MKLNRDKPFIERFGDERGVRYIQNDMAFGNNGKAMGDMVDGKFRPFTEEVKLSTVEQYIQRLEQTTPAVNLDGMDLNQLKDHAASVGVAFNSKTSMARLKKLIAEVVVK